MICEDIDVILRLGELALSSSRILIILFSYIFEVLISSMHPFYSKLRRGKYMFSSI